jgi:uncharacterized Fe-S radical SAM superfamily protein PflX
MLTVKILHRAVEQWPARKAHNLEVVGSNPASATNFKNTTMKHLYQELDELLNTIKYSDDDGLDNLYDDLYFEDILETCKEIVKYIKE